MQVTVDEQKCVASGQCVLAAPEVFDQREDDGIAVLLDASPAGDQHEATREAAAVCPAAAIAVAE